MEEKKHLKNFKCQNPECKHEFLADEFEALECPVCHTEEIAPLRPPLTKYFGMGALVIIAVVLIILFSRGCSGGGPKLEPKFDTVTCELKAFVDNKEDQPYVYILDNNIRQEGKSTFRYPLNIGNHTVCIYNIDKFDHNSTPVACTTIVVTKTCDGNDDNNSNTSGPPVQTQLQILGLKPGKLFAINFIGGTGAAFEFSITGMNGPFQKNPDFPNAPCKVYKPGELVVKCISDGQIAHNPLPLRFDGCKQVISSNPPPPAGPNSSIKTLFDCLISGCAKIRDSYEINPGNMSEPIQVFHPNNSIPETIPFYDYMVRLTADNSIKISNVTSGFKWGTDSKGKQVPMPINIKVYETN